MFTKRSISVLVFSLFSSFTIGLVSANSAFAESAGSDRVLIKIRAHQDGPNVLNVSPGTTVLWQNEAGQSVKVKFISQGVSTTCKEPRGFGGDVYGIHESSRISGGEVASLCFLEPNEYRYRVESADSKSGLMEGTIHVALDSFSAAP